MPTSATSLAEVDALAGSFGARPKLEQLSADVATALRRIRSASRSSPASIPRSACVSARHRDASFELGRSTCFLLHTEREDDMTESVYKVIELIGTSNQSWEKAAANAVEQAAKSLRDLRVAEVVELDLQLDAKGKIEAYRAKLNVSFKFEGT
jgi:flavin-binding protein dodecin